MQYLALSGGTLLPLVAAKRRPCRERNRAADTRVSVGNAGSTPHVSHRSRNQDAGRGAISYSRGIIKIVELQKLKDISCECYETLREEAPHSLAAPPIATEPYLNVW